MTYSSGNIIDAADYNGFATTINNIWGPNTNLLGTSGYGYNQSTTLATVAAGAEVTALQWSNLNSRISSIANHTGTTITSRTGPVVSDIIATQTALQTDINNCAANRGNAVASGTTINSWTTGTGAGKTTDTISGSGAWTITWRLKFQIAAFSANAQANAFWNAGGLLKLQMSKTSVTYDADPDWNNFIANMGTFYMPVGGVLKPQTIAGTTYNGFTRIGGSGTPTIYNRLGIYDLNTTSTDFGNLQPVFTLYNPASPYTGDNVSIAMSWDPGYLNGRQYVYCQVTWNAAARATPGALSDIAGGTQTNSPFTAFGTAPVVLGTVINPSTTYLTPGWSYIGTTINWA